MINNFGGAPNVMLSFSFFVIAEGELRHHEGTSGQQNMTLRFAFGDDKKKRGRKVASITFDAPP